MASRITAARATTKTRHIGREIALKVEGEAEGGAVAEVEKEADAGFQAATVASREIPTTVSSVATRTRRTDPAIAPV